MKENEGIKSHFIYTHKFWKVGDAYMNIIIIIYYYYFITIHDVV